MQWLLVIVNYSEQMEVQWQCGGGAVGFQLNCDGATDVHGVHFKKENISGDRRSKQLHDGLLLDLVGMEAENGIWLLCDLGGLHAISSAIFFYLFVQITQVSEMMRFAVVCLVVNPCVEMDLCTEGKHVAAEWTPSVLTKEAIYLLRRNQSTCTIFSKLNLQNAIRKTANA
ncbi:hypothetical protein C5167_029092 [Papaver somniferum]|nr:hypothetical protein C5167_029092 [Papaver somniferum]